MRNLKTFEAFAGRPLPVAPLHLFTNYYSCPSCKSIYISMDKGSSCRDCGKEVNLIDEKEFDSEIKKRVSPEEYKVYLSDKENFMDEIIPLSALDRDDEYYN